MQNSTLDLKIVFEGDDSILAQISEKLVGHDENNTSNLAEALSAIVQQTLIAAGTPGDFNVKIHQSQIKRNFGQSGGLNANEWLEAS